MLAALYLEIGWFYYEHFHFETSKKWFEKAGKSTGFEYELTAALGRRTKWQEKATSQLFLNGKSRDVADDESAAKDKEENEEVVSKIELGTEASYEREPGIPYRGKISKHNADGTVELTFNNQKLGSVNTNLGKLKIVSKAKSLDVPDYLPKIVILDDETLLDQIKFEQQKILTRLIPLDQCVLLGLACVSMKLRRAANLSEGVQATYLERILKNQQSWGIQMRALELRSYGEVVSKDKLIRAIGQFESLVIEYERIDKPQTCLEYVFQCGLRDRWHHHTSLGDAYMRMALYNSAITVYERIGNLEKQCECLAYSRRKKDAEDLILSLLEKKRI